MNTGRREFLRITSSGLLGLTFSGFPFSEDLLAEESRIIDAPSRKREMRPLRESTDFFALHTTEANLASSINSLMRHGGANYLIDIDGKTYRIMNTNQVSHGLGRSMWGGVSNLDNHSINIEFVGTYTEEPTRQQLSSGKRLLSNLKRIYPNVKDNCMMPHSMMAYGTPNKLHRKSHRGRKKGCGVLFARDDIRKKLGIGPAPYFDPDVREGRLIAGNPDLESALYQGGSVPYENGWPNEYEKTVSIIHGGEVWDALGDEYPEPTTLYFFDDGVKTGEQIRGRGFDFNIFPEKIDAAVGYVYGGYFSRTGSARSRVGKGWNLPWTFYRFPNKAIKNGDEVGKFIIPPGTFFFTRR